MAEPTLLESALRFQLDQIRARGLFNNGPTENGYVDEFGRTVPSIQKVLAGISQDAVAAVEAATDEAEQLAAAAEASAGAAQIAAVQTQAAVTAARAQAENATTSAAAALAASRTYGSEPIGRAASTDGQYFLERVSNLEFAVWRRDSAAASTRFLPNLMLADGRTLKMLPPESGAVFAILGYDANGITLRALEVLWADGARGITNLQLGETGLTFVGGVRIQILDRPGYLSTEETNDGGILRGVTTSGIAIGTFTDPAAVTTPVELGDLLVYTMYGQSNGESNSQTAPLPGTRPGKAVMFNAGPRPQDQLLDRAGAYDTIVTGSLVPFKEQMSGTFGETCLGGWLTKRYTRFPSLPPATTPRYLGYCPARSGQNISSLSKGSSSGLYDRAVYGWNRAKALAAGGNFGLLMMGMFQGEADQSASQTTAAYMTRGITLRNDFTADARTILGNPAFQLPMVWVQVASHTNYPDVMGNPKIAVAHLRLAREQANHYLATPAYIFPYVDGLHLNSSGQRWLGGYMELAAKTIEAGQPWKHLDVDVANVTRVGAVITLPILNAVGNLVLDMVQVSDPGHAGFVALAPDRTTVLPISSVVASGTDVTATLTITLASDPGGSVVVRAGWGAYSPTAANIAGPTTGPRLNVRDSLGDTEAIAVAGEFKRLDKWLPIQDEIVTT